MKKRHLLLFFVIGLLFGCSEENIPIIETQVKAISFSSVISENSTTRVAGTNWENGDIIGIYALKHGVTPDAAAITEENLPFVTTGDGKFYAKEKNIFFPEEDAAIDLISYFPRKNDLTGFHYPIDISEQPEFLYSNNLTDVSKVSGKSTTLIFKRILTRVVFTVTPSVSGESLEGLTASIDGAIKLGSFNLLDGTLSQDKTSATTLPMAISGNTSAKELSLILLPTEAENTLTVHITVGTHNFKWIIPHPLEKGKIYRYNIRLDSRQPTGDFSTPYMEVPAYRSSSSAPNSLSAFHMVETKNWLNSSYPTEASSIRNYVVLFDTQNRVPYWVAYPMHPMYLASGNRTDAWEYDPLIPQNVQPNLYSGWQSTTFNRGHLLASADRNATRDLNKTTFYFTNMVPQNGTMNENTWASLEEKVRYWCKQTSAYDTLYVVTGCILPKPPEPYSYAYDVNENRSVIPKYLYKALLRKIKTTGNFTSIAFIMENAATGIPYNDARSVTSVARLESETGFIFFPNLPGKIAETVKQNSSLSPHWE